MTAKDAYLLREWTRIYVEYGRLRPIPIFVVEFGEPIQLRNGELHATTQVPPSQTRP